MPSHRVVLRRDLGAARVADAVLQDCSICFSAIAPLWRRATSRRGRDNRSDDRTLSGEWPSEARCRAARKRAASLAPSGRSGN